MMPTMLFLFILFAAKISLILCFFSFFFVILNGADTLRQSNESFSPFVQIDDFLFCTLSSRWLSNIYCCLLCCGICSTWLVMNEVEHFCHCSLIPLFGSSNNYKRQNIPFFSCVYKCIFVLVFRLKKKLKMFFYCGLFAIPIIKWSE